MSLSDQPWSPTVDPQVIANGDRLHQPEGQCEFESVDDRPAVNGHRLANPFKGSSSRPRGLNVDRALQYSPISSIVPYSSSKPWLVQCNRQSRLTGSADIVPVPNANVPGPISVFETPSERDHARRPLDFLNQELAKGAGSSSVAEHVERDLKALLDPDTITDYKFKTPQRRQRNRNRQPATTNGNVKAAHTSGVSVFANKILHQTDVAYRYPTPISPGVDSPMKPHFKATKSPTKSSPTQKHVPHPTPSPPVPQHSPKPQVYSSVRSVSPLKSPSALPSYVDPSVLQKVSATTSSSPFADNQRAFMQNGPSVPKILPQQSPHNPRITEVPAVGVQIPVPSYPLPPSTVTPGRQAPHASTLQPAVVITAGSDSARVTDFVTYDVPKPSNETLKRKREGETTAGSLTKDQRAEADEAVRRLHEVIGDIFEVDDEAQIDSAGNQSSSHHQSFIQIFHEGSTASILAPSILIQLETALQKVISLKRLEEVPVDHLRRMQTLCMTAIASAENTDLIITEETSSDELESLLERFDIMDHGLRSARIVLRIMTGGLEDKQLYPEELLQSVARTVQKAVGCVVPLVESRSSQNALFESASSQKKVFSQLQYNTNKVLGLLVKLVGSTEMAEAVIVSLEFCAVGLLFVENAPSEKDSVLGILKFEALRRSAMDMITNIYSRYPLQRTSLFTEILSSLQKLPTGRQAKRHFKLANGKSIQVVSALIMQLVQTIATFSSSFKKVRRPVLKRTDDDDSDNEASNEIEDKESVSEDSAESDDDDDSHQSVAMQRLDKLANGLCNSAATSASFAARYLVGRAQTSSKTGDDPHRQLLEIFLEDLLVVLSVPEWPAAELLLRALFKSCADIIDDSKSLAPAKNMALEVLGLMGSAISDLVSNTQHAAKGFENQESEMSGWLREMVNDYTSGSLEMGEIVAWNGPFHAVVDSLHSSSADYLQGTSSHGYCLAQWAKAVCSADVKGSKEVDLAHRLRKGLMRTASLPFDSQDQMSPAQSLVAYALVILNMDFCRQFDYILKVLLRSINTETTTVRSRALRSVTQMLEKDPTLLDRSRDFRLLIGQCTTDGSPMVRDNALTLIAKCVSLRPALEPEFTPNVLNLANDPAVGVRKRTMKLLKDMYLRSRNQDMKARIGDCLLQRAQDIDAGVAEIARQTFEDIWMTPFWSVPELKDANTYDRIRLKEQVSLIVQTAQRSEDVRKVLKQLLTQILADGSKFANSNFNVCKLFVATSFETILDAADNRLQQQQTLLTLTVFAEAKPSLFTSDQLQILQPYIGNLSSTDDLNFFRSTVIVFRCVLPELSESHQELRRSIQVGLLGSIQKLYKTELHEVAQCLWRLNSSLQNPEKLTNLTKAVLSKLHSMRNDDFGGPSQQDNLKRMKKYLWIAAAFGKHCDFEAYEDVFHKSLPWWSTEGGPSVADLIVQSMKPFTSESQPLALRIEALESIGNVCQAWPRQFTKSHISSAFADILQKGEPDLQSVVLGSFRNFLQQIESQAASRSADAPLGADATKGGKLGTSATASESDGASTLIAQVFLPDLLKVALATQGDAALTAAEVISSINRQGLAHPRASVSAIVALETSTNPHIANVALESHKILHQQHESALEQEYMRSVHGAFRYQRDIAMNTFGYTAQPAAAKLKGLWEVIRTSVGKYQKKFLSNFIAKINFDITKMDLTGSPPNTLQFSRFITENLAFFEYTRLDELLHAISCMENVVASTGSGLAHTISTEIFHITVEVEQETEEPIPCSIPPDGGMVGLLQAGIPPSSGLSEPPPASQPKTVDPARLYVLTTGSIILSSVWEARTYLRRLYGQSSNQQRREGAKTKGAAKDLSKAPNRVQGITGEKLISAIARMVAALDSESGMMEQCQKFVDLMKIDDEVKVADGSEEGSFDRQQTPSRNSSRDRDTPMSGSSRGHKRKGSESLAGTPGKRKRGRPSLKRSRSSRKSLDGDGGDDDEDWV